MKILYCRVGWMKYYQGITNDIPPSGGGSYNLNNVGHECYNFQNINGVYCGFVQVPLDGKININRIDGNKSNTDRIDNVTVVFISKYKNEKGARIVGWYNDATVYRNKMYLSEEALEHRDLKHINYSRITSNNAVLLSEDERDFNVDYSGQSNIWYGNKETNSKVLTYIANYSLAKLRSSTMKPIKIEAGDLKQNLKWYMFITNEYGKPTDESIDLFITSFVNYLKNGTFSLNDRQSFDNWWAEIEKDLSDRDLYHLANCNGGYEWFKQIGASCKDKTFESDEELKQYILNSGDIEYMPQYKLDFNVTKGYIEIEHDEVKGQDYVRCHADRGGYRRDFKLYEDNTTVVLPESYVDYLKPSATEALESKRNELEEAEKFVDNLVMEDIEFNSPSGALAFCCGQPMNGWVNIFCGTGNDRKTSIDIYRQPKVAEQKQVEVKDEVKKDLKPAKTDNLDKRALAAKMIQNLLDGENNNVTSSESDTKTSKSVSNENINNARCVIKANSKFNLKQKFPSDLTINTDAYGNYIFVDCKIRPGKTVKIKLYDTGHCILLKNQIIPEANGDWTVELRTKYGIALNEHIEEKELWCNSFEYLTRNIISPNDSCGRQDRTFDEKGRAIIYLFRDPSYGKVVLDVDLVVYIKEQQEMDNWDDKDDRIVSLKTGDNTYSWYRYNSIRNEFKLIKGSEHSIESEYHDYDEWLRNQMEKAIREIELSEKEYIKDVETSAKVTYLDVANLSKDNEDTAVETSKQSTLSIDNLRCKFANYAEIGEGHKRRHKELTLTCNSVKFIVNTDSGELVQVDNEVRYDSILNYLSTFCTSEEQAETILKESLFKIHGREIEARRVYQ